MKEKGFIEKDDTPRGIKLLSSVKDKLSRTVSSVKLPILGMIPAGGPVLSEEYISSWMDVGEGIAGSAEGRFLLTVTGDSMIDAAIVEGDLAVVNSNTTPKNGDIVVALVDGANTLKRFIKEAGKVYLKAENKNYKDIYPENDLQIQGVVTTIIRQIRVDGDS